MAYRNKNELLDIEGDLFGWDDESSISLTNEALERDAAAERQIELESALEHDEHPLHDEVELETEEEEAAPTSEKRLKREIRAEAVRRLEEAARTEADFSVVIKEWDKLDQNRERRERNYEHLRGDLPLDYQAVSEPKLIPRWMNDTAYRQMMAGNFLDILFNCPYEMHQLTADPFISRMIADLSEDHKEVLYFLSLRLWSATQLALAREQSDRNIRKLRKTIYKNLQRQMFGYLYSKRERGKSLTLRERQFIEEYSALAEEQGKDVVIRRENKTNRRKGKPPLATGTAEGE